MIIRANALRIAVGAAASVATVANVRHTPGRAPRAEKAGLYYRGAQKPWKGASPAMRFFITASTVITAAGTLAAGHAAKWHRKYCTRRVGSDGLIRRRLGG